jgi:hypothetical protein
MALPYRFFRDVSSSTISVTADAASARLGRRLNELLGVGNRLVWIEEAKPSTADLKRTILEMIDYGYSARDIARIREVTAPSRERGRFPAFMLGLLQQASPVRDGECSARS